MSDWLASCTRHATLERDRVNSHEAGKDMYMCHEEGTESEAESETERERVCVCVCVSDCEQSDVLVMQWSGADRGA